MKKTLLFTAVLIVSCSHGQFLDTIESVEYDPVNHRFLVSNGDNVVEVDGDGNPLAYFGATAEADYGMEIMNGRLFTIVGSSVRAYDLTAGIEVLNVPVPGAQFLNGMASDGENFIWMTDFGAKKIFQLDISDFLNPAVSTIVANTVSTPNGIVYDPDGNRLIFVSWNANAKIRQVSLPDFAVSDLITTSLTNCDGIDRDNSGHFYVSSWQPEPRITRYDSNFGTSETISAPGLSAPADICYAGEIETLAIPNSGNSTVTFVGFGGASVLENKSGMITITCSPNPVNAHSVISFRLSGSGRTSVVLRDMTGRLVYQLLDDNLSAGLHKLVLAGLKFESGVYLCAVEQDGLCSNIRLVQE
jgi:hypothetical protein